MKRVYQKPLAEAIGFESSQLLASSSPSVGMYEEENKGASSAYTQKKDIWDADNWLSQDNG